MKKILSFSISVSKQVNIVFFILFSTNHVLSETNTWERINWNTNYNSFKCVQELNDSNIITTGIVRVGSFFKMYIVKFNPKGDTIYSKIFDLNTPAVYTASWIEETGDNGFIIAGSGPGTLTDSYLLKMDSNGNFEWFKQFGGNDLDQGICVKQTSDGGFILLSKTYSFGSTSDILVTKTDKFGNQQWNIVVDTGFDDLPSELDKIDSTGYIIAAKTIGYSIISKLNLKGHNMWIKRIDSIEINSIQTISNKDFIIAGSSYIFGTYNSFVAKTDSSANVLWRKFYNSKGFEECFSISERKDKKSYAFSGWADTANTGNYRHAMLKIIDNYGVLINEKFFRPGKDSNRFWSVSNTYDNGFIFSGIAGIDGGYGYLVKTDSTGIISTNISTHYTFLQDYQVFQNYPNPFNSSTKIDYFLKFNSFVSIKIYNVLGKCVFEEILGIKQSGKHSYTFISDPFLSSGVYYYSFIFNETKITNKFLLIK